MNIGYVVTDLSLGGTPAFVEYASLGLLRRGHSVTIVAEKAPHDRAERLREAGVTVHAFESPVAVHDYAKCFRESKVDVVHLNVWERADSLLGLKKTLGVPIVMSYHHVPRTTKKMRVRQLLQLARSGKRLREAYGSSKACDAYIGCCAASASAARIEMWPFGLRKIFSLPNAVETPGRMISKEVLCGPAKFVQVGTLNERKDPIATLSAFAMVKKRVSQAELTYLGDGPLRQRLCELIDEQKITGVRVLGELRNVSDALQEANIAVLPSWMEGLPYTLIEAAAVGMPLVASRVDGIPEIAVDGINALLFKPGDIPALAEAMTRLAASADLRESFGAAGRIHVRENFGMDEHLDKLSSIYRLVCNRNRRTVTLEATARNRPQFRQV